MPEQTRITIVGYKTAEDRSNGTSDQKEYGTVTTCEELEKLTDMINRSDIYTHKFLAYIFKGKHLASPAAYNLAYQILYQAEHPKE